MSSESSAPRAGATRVTDPSRRALLRAGAAALFACPSIAACEFIELEQTGGPPGGGEGVPFSLDDPAYEALQTVGAHACVQLGPIAAILLRASEDRMIAFERFCPHQANPIATCDGSVPAQVGWNADTEELTCPWHNARFSANGARRNQVAPRDLVVFPVDFDPARGEGRIRLARGGQ